VRKDEVIKQTKGICAKVDANMLFTIANSTKNTWEKRMASGQHRVGKPWSEKFKAGWSNNVAMHNTKEALVKLNSLPKTPRNTKQLVSLLKTAESRKTV
jgi:hypothetical protein